MHHCNPKHDLFLNLTKLGTKTKHYNLKKWKVMSHHQVLCSGMTQTTPNCQYSNSLSGLTARMDRGKMCRYHDTEGWMHIPLLFSHEVGATEHGVRSSPPKRAPAKPILHSGQNIELQCHMMHLCQKRCFPTCIHYKSGC